MILKFLSVVSLISGVIGQTVDPHSCSNELADGDFAMDDSDCIVYVCSCFNHTGTFTCVTREYEVDGADAEPYVQEICDPVVKLNL